MACWGSKSLSNTSCSRKRPKCSRRRRTPPPHTEEEMESKPHNRTQGQPPRKPHHKSSGQKQPQAVDTPPPSQKSFFRKKLDPETVQYYTEISSLLEKSSSDAEERAILCSNALDDSHGKELQLVCDKVFSRLFENLILSCEKDQLCQFLLRCIKFLPSIAMDQVGSHVVEAALKSLSLALQDCDAKGESHAIIKDVLTKICQEVAENATDIMCNQYGSHVLRSLLCLCNGTLLESLDEVHTSNPASTLAGRLSGLPIQSSKNQRNPESLQAFPYLLKLTVKKILEYCRDSIAIIRADNFGSLVFQTILRLLKGDNEAVVKVITVLLDCGGKNVMKEGKILEDALVQNVSDLIMDPASSHLMEVILEVAPDYLYMEILNRFFRHSLYEIATHKSGNFVVQTLISSAKDEGQVNMIWGELGSKFPELLKDRKSGVVASLIAACRRFHTHEHECCRAMTHAVNFDGASPNSIVPHILHLENFSGSAKGSDWQWPSGNKMSVLGCLMLQNIFTYQIDFIQQFCSSFASMEIDQILETARDPGGSRVIEAFLSSKAPLKHKHRVISKFRGHFGELAQRISSSFTVSKCFRAADVSRKELIACELAAVQIELSRLKHGPHLLRICDVTRYAKGPEQWRSSQSSKQSARQAFAQEFGTEDEARVEDDNGLNLSEGEATEMPKKTGKKQMKKRALENTGGEMDKTLWNKQDASELEHSMAELGFATHKRAKTKDDNGKSRMNASESDNNRLEIASTEAMFSGRVSMGKDGKDDIEEIFSKKSRANKSNKGSKMNDVQNNLVKTAPVQVSIDSSLNNVLNILEKGSKKKKRCSSDKPSTLSAKKQKQGKQMVYM